MAKVISFISRKGGTGKTTNAINLATMLANLGHKPLLIETDTNYTLSTLRKMELFKTGAKDKSLFQIVGSEDKDVNEDLVKLQKKKQYDFLIVDSAGKTTDENIKKLSVASDLIIVPTSLTQNDLLVTYQTVEDLKPAREINPKIKLAILPNRIHSLTKTATVQKAMEELGVHVIDTIVPSKNIYANFSTILPEKEYLSATKEILKILNAKS